MSNPEVGAEPQPWLACAGLAEVGGLVGGLDVGGLNVGGLDVGGLDVGGLNVGGGRGAAAA